MLACRNGILEAIARLKESAIAWGNRYEERAAFCKAWRPLQDFRNGSCRAAPRSRQDVGQTSQQALRSIRTPGYFESDFGIRGLRDSFYYPGLR